jgi:endo-1,4-beta-xylanase
MCSPHKSGSSLGAITACLVAAALTGCGNSGGGGGESGRGGAATGGSTGGIGTGGSSGVTSSGGVSGSGVTAGSNGVAGSTSGGVAGSGGIAGSSGISGSTSGGIAGSSGISGSTSGGMAGTGGSTGGGGASGSAGSSGAGNAGAAGTSSSCPPATPLTGGNQYCSNMRGNAGGGYIYELWAEGSGTGCMRVHGVNATFSATWSNEEDFLARVGLGFDQTRTPSEIGVISAEFAETKTEQGGGLTYIGIYGWTVSPLVEYYILDDWGMTKPAGFASDGTPRTHKGTITVDGGTYDVYTHTRVNKPAITGDNMTFEQYFSIRQTARQCGHISVSEHFSEWADLDMPLGNLHETTLLMEAQNNSGSIAFTTATVVVQ